MTKAQAQSEVTAAQARQTALVVACVLLLIAAWSLYRGHLTAVYILCALAATLILTGFFVPALARPFHKLWMRLAFWLGYINSHILLTLMYYLVFTPYGFFSRLFGRDPLNRRGPQRETYWTPRKTTRQAKEQFERLF